MFIKVKQLEEIYDLILEAELIQIGDDLSRMISQKSGEDQEKKDSTDSTEKTENQSMDELLDKFVKMSEDEFKKRLNNPNFKRSFGRVDSKKLMEDYLDYLLSMVNKLQKDLIDELAKEEISEETVTNLKNAILLFAARLGILEKIYESLQNETDETGPFAKDLLTKISGLKKTIADAYFSIIEKTAEENKKAQAEYDQASKEDDAETTEKATEKMVDVVEITDIVLANISPDAETAKKENKQKVVTKITPATYEKAKGRKRSQDSINKAVKLDEDVIVNTIKDIINFNYETFPNEAKIRERAKKIKADINSLKETSDAVKGKLMRMVVMVESDLVERVNNKEFVAKKFKGIHYDWNKKLPMYTKTALPVTGKQIADDTKLMKFRKLLQSFSDFVAGDTSRSAAGEAFYQTGKFWHAAYAKTLNYTAMSIGKLIGGREGEMKADAISRQFISDTTQVDRPAPKAINEDAVAPGVSMQVPGSISGAGPIIPPTSTSFGSGDNFGPKINTKKKKTKKKGILDFKSFLKENNN